MARTSAGPDRVSLVWLAATLCAAPLWAGDAQIDAFNQALRDATWRMNDEDLAALWEDDGVSLLPDTPPLIGKKAIVGFIRDATASFPQAKMQKFDLACHDVVVFGDYASEWCSEHQVVIIGGGKPNFDGAGNLLLLLHRGSDGKWRLKREMWNHQPSPAS
jgi:uncharacterized protein (TIGR02246 family)